MKYLFIYPLALVFLLISALIGGVCYLWRFKQNDFFTGFRWLNQQTNVVKFFEKHT